MLQQLDIIYLFIQVSEFFKFPFFLFPLKKLLLNVKTKPYTGNQWRFQI